MSFFVSDLQELTSSLSQGYPKQVVRKHALVQRAKAKARTIQAKLDRLKKYAGKTKSAPNGVERVDGNTGRGVTHTTDKVNTVWT